MTRWQLKSVRSGQVGPATSEFIIGTWATTPGLVPVRDGVEITWAEFIYGPDKNPVQPDSAGQR